MRVLLISASSIRLSVTILFGMVYLGIANYVPLMSGWSDPPGKFSLALDATMLRAPFVISILFMNIGTLLALYQLLVNRDRSKVSIKKEIIEHLRKGSRRMVPKPNKKIFAIALDEINMNASDTWYIGDHPVNDILGSASTGLTPVWVHGIHPWIDGHDEPSFQIESISQLSSLIKDAAHF